MPGMRRSMITTSGRRRSRERDRGRRRRSPRRSTRICGERESARRRPSRTTSWSSAMRHVISSARRGDTTARPRMILPVRGARASRAWLRAHRLATAREARRSPRATGGIRDWRWRPPRGGTSRVFRRVPRSAPPAPASRGRALRGSARGHPGEGGRRWPRRRALPLHAPRLQLASSCSGRSESPGRIGAIPTPTSMPASASARIARRRLAGGAVPGSGGAPDARVERGEGDVHADRHFAAPPPGGRRCRGRSAGRA